MNELYPKSDVDRIFVSRKKKRVDQKARTHGI